MSRETEAKNLQKEWDTNPRWKGVARHYTADDVVRLRGSVQIEHTLARRGAEKLWHLLNTEPFVNTLATPTWPAKCIPTSRCTRPTRCRKWSGASITPSSAPTRSSGAKARATP